MDWTKELNKLALEDKPVWLYVLELEDNCWYIGLTKDIKKRFSQHKSGKGAWWTKAHKPIRIAKKQVTDQTDRNLAVMLETALTMEYIKKYGSDKVRGGVHTQYELELPNNII